MSSNIDEIETIGGRKPFTKGWSDHLNTSHALPIKKSGQVIQVYRTIPSRKESHTSDEEDDDNDNANHGDDNNDDNTDDETEFENFDDDINNSSQNRKSKNVKNKKSSTLSIDNNDTAQALIKPISKHEFNHIQMILAEICTTICADPQQALKRKKTDDGSNIGTNKPNGNNKKGKKQAVYSLPSLSTPSDTYRLSDLFDLIRHPNYKVKEMAILSTLLVFKDIIPGQFVDQSIY